MEQGKKRGEFHIKPDLPNKYPLPLVFSMPFAKGEVLNIDEIRIIEGGKDIPAQYKVLNRWDDGSLQWVQGVSNVSKRFRVLYNQGTYNKIIDYPVETRLDGSEVALVSGGNLLKVDLKEGKGDFVSGNRRLSFSLSRLIDEKGIIFHAKEGRAQILEEGPLRGTIRIQGEHVDDSGRRFMRFDIFISMYAHTPILEITHALGVNDMDDSPKGHPEFLSISSMDIPITLHEEKIERAYAFTEGGKKVQVPVYGRLFQCEDFEFEVSDGEAHVSEKGTRANGSVLFETDKGGIFTAVPEFWQQYPKGFAVADSHISIELFPKLGESQKLRYSEREDDHIWYYYLHDDLYKMRQGIEKSHKLYIGLTELDSHQVTNAKLRGLLSLPVCIPDFEYLNKTKVLGELVPSDGPFGEWDRLFKEGFSMYMKKLKEERWYGVLNWGDWHGEREYNWGNLEYDDAAGFFLQALRFGEPEYFRQGVRGAKHYMDVDTITYHPNEDWIGRVWVHSLGHTGGYYDEGDFSLNNYDMDDSLFHTGRRASPGHTRCEGLSLLYRLTGDIRALEHTKKIADSLSKDRMVTEGATWITAREPGWAMVALTAAYDGTGDKSYLDVAQKIADLVIKLADGRGVWHRPLESRNCMYLKFPEHPRCIGELSFPVAFQSAGMIRVYERTGRDDIKRNIIEAAQYVMEKIYRRDLRAFQHSPCPLREQKPKLGDITGVNIWYPLAFAYKETRDKEILRVIKETWNETDEYNAWFGDYPIGPPQKFTGTILFMPKIQALLAPFWNEDI